MTEKSPEKNSVKFREDYKFTKSFLCQHKKKVNDNKKSEGKSIECDSCTYDKAIKSSQPRRTLNVKKKCCWDPELHNLTFDIYENINTHQNCKNTEKRKSNNHKKLCTKNHWVEVLERKKDKRENKRKEKKNYINDSEEESESINW